MAPEVLRSDWYFIKQLFDSQPKPTDRKHIITVMQWMQFIGSEIGSVTDCAKNYYVMNYI